MYKTEVKCIVFVFLHYNRHMGEKQGSNVQIGDTVSLIDKILQFVCAGSLNASDGEQKLPCIWH